MTGQLSTTPARRGSSVLERPREFVALGPVAGTDWCVVPELANTTLEAPGGVVLCHEGTSTPHPGAERAALSAWAVLRRWQGQRSLPFHR